MPERVVHEYDRDDAVVVDQGGGSGAGVVLGILVVLAILAAVWWFTLGPGMAGSGVDVNINPAPSVPAAS